MLGAGSWTANAEEQWEKGSHTVRTGRFLSSCQCGCDTRLSLPAVGRGAALSRPSEPGGREGRQSVEVRDGRGEALQLAREPLSDSADSACCRFTQRCRALVQEFKSHSVSKYSPYHILDGEAYWYQHAPPAAQKHIPALISCKIQVRRGDCQAFGSRVRNACAAGSLTRRASSSWSG